MSNVKSNLIFLYVWQIYIKLKKNLLFYLYPSTMKTKLKCKTSISDTDELIYQYDAVGEDL